MCQIDGLLDCRPGGNHTDVDLLLSGQSQARDDASAQVDQGAIHPRHTSVRVERGQPSDCATATPEDVCLWEETAAAHRTEDTSQ
jgi:hypothetical protein